MAVPDQLQAPDRSRRGRVPGWLDRCVRVVLLLVLAAGAGASLLQQFASPATLGEFDAGLAAGRVAVATVEGDGTLRWSGDWVRWRRAEVTADPLDPEAWLRGRVAASSRPVTVGWIDAGLAGRLGGPAWPPLRWAMVGTALASLVLMFARRRRWFADRSGWFWLFAGGLGAPAFLLLEPEPLWARPGRLPRWSRWRRLPLGPGGGFLLGWVGVAVGLVLVDLLG